MRVKSIYRPYNLQIDCRLFKFRIICIKHQQLFKKGNCISTLLYFFDSYLFIFYNLMQSPFTVFVLSLVRVSQKRNMDFVSIDISHCWIASLRFVCSVYECGRHRQLTKQQETSFYYCMCILFFSLGIYVFILSKI